MKHEEKHAVGMWLVALFLGGFALLLWATGRLDRDDDASLPRPPAEARDSTA